MITPHNQVLTTNSNIVQIDSHIVHFIMASGCMSTTVDQISKISGYLNTENLSTSFDRIIRLPECTELTGRSAVSILHDKKKRTFPARVRRGENAVGWRLSEVQKLINARENVTAENCKQVAPGAKRGRKPRKNGKEA